MQMNLRLGLALIGACALTYLLGWCIPLMEIDAAQYANISREMLRTGHYLEIFDRGKDYLDKPPMLFWLSALSMRIFGVHDWAYRLPSYLFSLLAIYSTYRLALIYYRREIALLSAVVLASCQALFLINHDVRTDTMLMGWVIFSIWQLAAWFKFPSWGRLLLLSIGLAGGLMTKGPIALIVPVFCLGSHFFLQRKFRQFFRWEYIPMLCIIGVLLIPMCIGLYRQYDMHPGKVIDRITINSGLRFFFWTQSFGRITGESAWHENDSFFFLFQNMLWAFLPWIIFFVIGLVRDIRHLFRVKFRLPEGEEWITTGGFILTYCSLAISRYQLPHYIFVVFPLAAIIAAKAFYTTFFEGAGRGRKALRATHLIIFSLLWVALIALLFLPFPELRVPYGIAAIIAAGVWVIAWARKASLVTLAVLTMVGINAFLGIAFYPRLLQYQLNEVVEEGMRREHIPPDRLFIYKMDEERALDFYTDHLYKHVDDLSTLKSGDCILTNEAQLDSLGSHQGLDLIYDGKYFHVSTLDLPFLNPNTRDRELTPIYILRKAP